MLRVLWRSRKRIGLFGAVLLASLVATVLLTRGSAVADVTTFTIDADFELETLQGVNHDDPDHDQLQLNETGTTFPIMWISNAGEDTVSKIDTNTGKELARYRTWFAPNTLHGAWTGPAPSRTAVDSDGNVYDSGSITTDWGTVSWTDSIPTDASVEVSVSVADTQAGLDVETFQQVSNGVAFTATGRFIEIQVKFTANQGGDSPILFDIEVQFAPLGGYVAP